jgi:hypothetical protein
MNSPGIVPPICQRRSRFRDRFLAGSSSLGQTFPRKSWRRVVAKTAERAHDRLPTPNHARSYAAACGQRVDRPFVPLKAVHEAIIYPSNSSQFDPKRWATIGGSESPGSL